MSGLPNREEWFGCSVSVLKDPRSPQVGNRVPYLRGEKEGGIKTFFSSIENSKSLMNESTH